MVTRKEVLGWLNANQGQAIGFNNGADIQCVDLVNYVTQKFFGKAMFVGVESAKDIWNMNFPADWQKIPISQGSQPGDVFVSGAASDNIHGHTGIIAEDNNNVYDENYAGRKYISRHIQEYIPNMIGFIRPPYSDGNNGNIEKGEKKMMISFNYKGVGYSAVDGVMLAFSDLKYWAAVADVSKKNGTFVDLGAITVDQYNQFVKSYQYGK